MVEGSGSGNWSQYQLLVLGQLKELKDEVGELRGEIHALQREEIGALKVEVAMLKVKSGLWGAAAGFIPAMVVATMVVLERIT